MFKIFTSLFDFPQTTLITLEDHYDQNFWFNRHQDFVKNLIILKVLFKIGGGGMAGKNLETGTE